MHDWVARYRNPEAIRKAEGSTQSEIQRLKSELQRVTKKRDILKEAAISSTRQRNTFFNDLFGYFKIQSFSWSTV
jgi:transposase-like protein